jgi:hypothetical protein
MNRFKVLQRASALALVFFLGGSALAQQGDPAVGAGVTRLVITKQQIAFGGAAFGTAGAYEVLSGTVYGELDPKAPGNAGIVNVGLAPLNARDHCDSRPSLEERYKSAQDYADKRKHAVDTLVQQGFVLPEDADALARSMPLPGTAQGKL